MKRILVVEDDPGIAFSLRLDLTTEGYGVEVEADGAKALARARSEPFDLILLDVMLPSKDGFEICRELRRGGCNTQILMLTARAQEAEKVLGLELGADDYITKPFSPRELRARVKTALRRTENSAPRSYSFGDIEVDLERCEIRRGGKAVDLTALEFKMLAVFLHNRGRVMSRERLLDMVWGRGTAVVQRVVDNHVVTLRRKIETDAGEPRYIVSVRGLGYRFDA
ncbi:MAG: response regulator transcription factor [Acidobacteria bacterium]|nr:response regulator transcription factor [Acidobacteriota bacterium]